MTGDIERLIGAKVRQLRTERGWTQADLARELDALEWPLDQTTISNLELGRRPVRIAEAEALAAVFGMSLVALLDKGAAAAERDLRKRISADVVRCILGPPEATQ